MVLAGMLEADEGGSVFNTQIVCSAQGELAGGYRKTQPGLSELPSFGAGDELPVFHHPKITFGIQICCEPNPPSLARCPLRVHTHALCLNSRCAGHDILPPASSAHSGFFTSGAVVNLLLDDTHFPVASMLLAEKGAELIFCPHASATAAG